MQAEIGVFGGSGFYSFLDDVEEVELDTPYGAPSAPVTVGTVGGRRVAFIPRHGREHTSLAGARSRSGRTSGRCACSACARSSDRAPSVRCAPDVAAGRLRRPRPARRPHAGRDDTFYDGDQVHHVSFADPVLPGRSRRTRSTPRARVGVHVHARGTIVVINGPRFSTRAESRWYRAQGWDVVSMTQYPEAYLARELGMHYTGIALVTDYDTGVEDDPGVEPVTMDQVLAVMDANVDRVRALLYELLPKLPADPTECSCASALGPLPHA